MGKKTSRKRGKPRPKAKAPPPACPPQRPAVTAHLTPTPHELVARK